MTNEFKVGDRVRLTGDIWKEDEMQMFGEVVRIDRVDSNGNAWFHYDNDDWVVDRNLYDAELVTDEEGQEVTDFKVGDRVRLTGYNWYGDGLGPGRGEVVEITRIDRSGTGWFDYASADWYIEDGGYDAELVTDETPLTYGDLQTVGDLAKALGEPPRHIGMDFISAAAIDPDHYKFPGGTEVRHISAHSTSFGGQAVQYVARSTRLDGKNKGDRVENLKKAIRMIEWEIERIQDEEK